MHEENPLKVRLNRVVTYPVWFAEELDKDEEIQIIKPGLFELSSILVRECAHEIILPYFDARGITPRTLLKACPKSLQLRIKVVDKDQKILKRTESYLRPIREEIVDDPNLFHYLFDFLYKTALASQYEAEADVFAPYAFRVLLGFMRGRLRSDEAIFRLDQVSGIHNLYRKTEIDTFEIADGTQMFSISERIETLLEEAEIVDISENRYLLGFPGKVRVALFRIKKWVKKISSQAKYKNYLGIAKETINIAGRVSGTEIRIPELRWVHGKYNPPLVDLDHYKFELCRKFDVGNGFIRKCVFFDPMSGWAELEKWTKRKPK